MDMLHFIAYFCLGFFWTQGVFRSLKAHRAERAAEEYSQCVDLLPVNDHAARAAHHGEAARMYGESAGLWLEASRPFGVSAVIGVALLCVMIFL